MCPGWKIIGAIQCFVVGNRRFLHQKNLPILKSLIRLPNFIGSPPPATYVPYFTGDVGRDPTINYFFDSVPQTNAALCCGGV